MFEVKSSSRVGELKVKIFISWSGSDSKRYAEILKSALECGDDLQPFVSSTGITPGHLWYDSLVKQISADEFGLVCLTPSNLESQWIHFEIGMMAGCLRSRAYASGNDDNGVERIIPVLFDVSRSEVTGPLSHYQAINASSKEDFFRLVKAIYEARDASFETECRQNQIDDELELDSEIDKVWKTFSSGMTNHNPNYKYHCEMNFGGLRDVGTNLTLEKVECISKQLRTKKENLKRIVEKITNRTNYRSYSGTNESYSGTNESYGGTNEMAITDVWFDECGVLQMRIVDNSLFYLDAAILEEDNQVDLDPDSYVADIRDLATSTDVTIQIDYTNKNVNQKLTICPNGRLTFEESNDQP